MTPTDIPSEITSPHQVGDTPQANLKKLLNYIERLCGENESLKIELQQLKDEINRLKGEQGKPDIKANKTKNKDISSEKERKEAEANAENDNDDADATLEAPAETEAKKKRQRSPKLKHIKIDHELRSPLDKTGLPQDLEFKGYEDVVVQDIVIKTHDIKYCREVYYSPSQKKSYRGE